ncbi:MAG: ABC transporter substrate-binding protein [Chloroflexota bacterium]
MRDNQSGHLPSRTRRQVLRSAAGAATAGGVVGLLGPACAMGGGQVPQKPGELSGTIDLTIQNNGPIIAIHEQTIASFKAIAPNVTLNYTTVPFSEMATKTSATAAAGAGAEMQQTYSQFWRGIDASSVFLPLTPLLMSRKEAGDLSVPTLLDSVWSKKREVYLIPLQVGVNGAFLQYNAAYFGAAGIDPKKLGTLDDIAQAATRLVVRQGQDITRAGLLPTQGTTCIWNWILDQGGKFYDEKSTKWTWETLEAERAFQWLLDLYDKHRVAWRTAPSGTTDPMGQGAAAARLIGPYSISTVWRNHPDMEGTVLDQPLPAFVPGKQPHYYLDGLNCMTLTAALDPDDVKAKIGAAYFRLLFSAENRMRTQANDYSGAILNYKLYTDPQFKETRFGAIRGPEFVEKVIKRTVTLNPAASPGPGPQWNKVLNGQLSIKAALAELQQVHQTAEDEALRSRGA